MLLTLPEPCSLQILSCLSMQDVLAVACTCKELNFLVQVEPAPAAGRAMCLTLLLAFRAGSVGGPRSEMSRVRDIKA